MSKKKMQCSAGELHWLQNQLAKARRGLNVALFNPNSINEVPGVNSQESAQAYMVLINFYQKAINAFSVEPGTSVTSTITISEKFVQRLKALDKDGLIDIEITPRIT